MRYENEPEWLRDRGVQIDRKGRIIVSLPAIPDDDIDVDLEEREPSIAELMRRDVDLRLGGSRGRHRRRFSVRIQNDQRVARAERPREAARVGRPTIGSEVRVHVQTMIAQRTRDTLAKHGATLADVLDACARELPDAS